MTSKLTKSQIEVWKKEGLEPSYDDIIKLNDLGLKVERGPDMFSFSAVPRMAFLGDNILREPTVAKRLWIDNAQNIIQADIQSRVYFLAYALGTDELPSLYETKEIVRRVEKFRDEVLLKFTQTQILAAIDWCLNGEKCPTDEMEEKEKKEIEDVYSVPDENAESLAKHLLLTAMSSGMPKEVADYALMDELKNMILVAAMENGAKDVVKNEHAQAAARFYAAAGKIHERLVNEKKKMEETPK